MAGWQGVFASMDGFGESTSEAIVTCEMRGNRFFEEALVSSTSQYLARYLYELASGARLLLGLALGRRSAVDENGTDIEMCCRASASDLQEVDCLDINLFLLH